MSDNRNEHIDRICSIRNAHADDAGRIKELYAQLSTDVSNVDRDFTLLLNDANAKCYILEEKGTSIGMVICYVRSSLSSGKKMVIDDLVIDHQHRRRGLGSLMMRHCIDMAKAESLDCVEVACSRSKSELHRFYEGMGLKHRMRLYSLIIEHA